MKCIDFSIEEAISYTNLKNTKSVSWGDLEDAVALEGLTASLTGQLRKNWHYRGTFRERIMITDPVEKLGMKLMWMSWRIIVSEKLESVKQHLTIENSTYLPNVDFVIYKNSRAYRMTTCIVNLKNHH